MKSFFFKLTGLLPCLFLAGFCAQSQTYEPDSLIVHARAIYDGNKAIVRWVPNNFETWQWGLDHGYRLERITVKDNGVDLTLGEIINSSVVLDTMLLPLPEMDWEPLADADDLAGVAAGVIYGDSMEVISTEDAGFMDVINLNQERENRFSFALFAADNSFVVAEAMGIGYEDNTVLADKEYVYKIKINDVPINTVARNGTASVETVAGGSLPVPSNLRAVPGDKSVLLTWDSEGLGEHYTSYCVEYSKDGGASYLPAHDLPLIFGAQRGTGAENAAFHDSLAFNSVNYIYRVKGKSPFGAMGPYSDTIHVVGRPAPLGANPAVLGVQELDKGVLTINWHFPTELESKINGFDVYRSDQPGGDFTKISTSLLPVNKRTFEDDDPNSVNYYKVKSTDENGYELSSNAMLGQPNDTDPPAAPTGVSGTSDDSGSVTLTWNKNTEEDLMGYRVFMSNTSEGDFAQVTGIWINDTVYQYPINLNTLSENVYFAVKAIDRRQNSSELSAPCTVERPDIIPPSAPFISKVTAEPGKVHFEWELSSSEDVVEYNFQRKPNGAPGWITLLSFDPLVGNPPLAFTDSTAKYSRYWDYRLQAIDDEGLIGNSNVVKAKPVDNGIRGAIKDFYALLIFYLYPSPGHIVTLGWNYDKLPGLVGFEIFRAFDNNEKRSYKFVTVEEAESIGTQMQGADFGFIDYDTDFRNVPVQTNYSASNLAFNTQVTGGTVVVNGNTTTIIPTSPNVPANPQNGVTIKYWVMAKYMDGAMSPLSDEAQVQF